MSSVEEGQRGEIALGAVGVVIAPAVARSAVGHIADGLQGGARPSVKHRQVFGPFHHTAIALGAHLAVAPVGRGVADGAPRAVDGAVGGLHHHLRPSVAVEVIGQDLGVVCPRTYVSSEVDAPQACAVQAIAIHVDGRGHPGLRVVVCVAGLPFQDDLILAVTIHIGHRGVVGRVGHGHLAQRLGRRLPHGVACGIAYGAARHLPPGPQGHAVGGGGWREGYAEIAVGGVGRQGERAVMATAAHGIGGCAGQGGLIHKAGAAPLQRLRVEPHAIAVDVKALAGLVGGQRAPRHDDLPAAAIGHHAAPQPLGLHLPEVVACLRRACLGTCHQGHGHHQLFHWLAYMF